ncbi:hypothetical protein BpHYR1_049809 [Brachionus plicatilis]|uniref:Uncharacterized protein n=1 Tax=Brachionus plicatilis TaxID=10195 RepID=A0A3M7RLP3_BRAPC|nr:hypothetical protein BpHYR1_049809 [Brachionus plicatilis]
MVLLPFCLGKIEKLDIFNFFEFEILNYFSSFFYKKSTIFIPLVLFLKSIKETKLQKNSIPKRFIRSNFRQSKETFIVTINLQKKADRMSRIYNPSSNIQFSTNSDTFTIFSLPKNFYTFHEKNHEF